VVSAHRSFTNTPTSGILPGAAQPRILFRVLLMPLCLLVFLILVGCAASPARNEYNPSLDAWPLLRIWSDTDRGAHHGEALGPLLEWRSDPEAGAFFFRPLYNRQHQKNLQLVQSEWLWPFGTGTFRPDLAREVFYPLALWDNETFPDGGIQKRRMLLPLFYYRSGRSPTDWFLLPFGGVLHNFLGRKKIVIALWPLYIYQTGDNVRSWSFLHPIFTYVRWNDGGTGYRFWPLFGVNRRPGKLKKTFILWPIYQKQWMKTQQGEFNRLFIFPFYGKIDDPAGWEWTVLWPFISRRKSGRGVAGRSFWPICSWETEQHETAGLEVKRSYVNFLWPLGWYRATHREYEKKPRSGLAGIFDDTPPPAAPKKPLRLTEDTMAIRLIPLFFREWEQSPTGSTGAWQLWPLIKYRNEKTETQLEFPSIFPFRYHAEWERNVAPLLRVFEYRKNRDNLRSWRFLWRLIRVDKGPQDRYFGLWPVWEYHAREAKRSENRWTFLKGLLGRERVGEWCRWRFLYFIHVESGGPQAEEKAKE